MVGRFNPREKADLAAQHDLRRAYIGRTTKSIKETLRQRGLATNVTRDMAIDMLIMLEEDDFQFEPDDDQRGHRKKYPI